MRYRERAIAAKGKVSASLLHLVAREGNLDIVEILVRKGFNVDKRDYYGITPLQSRINVQTRRYGQLSSRFQSRCIANERITALCAQNIRGEIDNG
jgi:hypothetical protein